MPEWWQQVSAEEIVDGFIHDLYSPQYPSASVLMHITEEAVLSQVRAVILQSETADRWTQRTFGRVASRPHQYHELRMPHEALKEFRDVYASVIRQLIALGVVKEIKCNYGF
jgi:hypothetical protein